MVSNEETPVLSYKHKYKELKRKLKYLAYENECFESDIKDAQGKLLQISREKSFLLDQLMSHESVVISENSDLESTDYSSDDNFTIPNYTAQFPPPTTEGRPKSKPPLNQTNTSPAHRSLPTKASIRGTSRKLTQRGGANRQANRKSNPKTTPTIANNIPKATPLSLVVSLPRPSGPAAATVSVVKKPVHPVRTSGKIMATGPAKKRRTSSSNNTSGTSSSSSDSESRNSSSTSDNEPRPPPPPLRLIDTTPIATPSNQVVLVPKPLQSPPINIMVPNTLTSLALVPPTVAGGVSTSSSLTTPTLTPRANVSGASNKIFVSVGDASLSAFNVVKSAAANNETFQDHMR